MRIIEENLLPVGQIDANAVRVANVVKRNLVHIVTLRDPAVPPHPKARAPQGFPRCHLPRARLTLWRLSLPGDPPGLLFLARILLRPLVAELDLPSPSLSASFVIRLLSIPVPRSVGPARRRSMSGTYGRSLPIHLTISHYIRDRPCNGLSTCNAVTLEIIWQCSTA